MNVGHFEALFECVSLVQRKPLDLAGHGLCPLEVARRMSAPAHLSV
jgi:hypothetical protein